MYILEGNIGAGKSTFLTMVQEKIADVSVALEPLHNWQKQVYGQSLLSNFYQEPHRWAYSMETFAMMCRVREHLVDQRHQNPNRFIERSIYSGHYCFSKNGYEQGFMTEAEWQAYEEWFRFLIPGKCKPPIGFIYLNVSPDVAYERILKRNRLAEKKITMHYLKQIDQRHKEFLMDKKDVLDELKNVPVLMLDCNEEFASDPQKFNEHIEKVKAFLAATQGAVTFTGAHACKDMGL